MIGLLSKVAATARFWMSPIVSKTEPAMAALAAKIAPHGGWLGTAGSKIVNWMGLHPAQVAFTGLSFWHPFKKKDVPQLNPAAMPAPNGTASGQPVPIPGMPGQTSGYSQDQIQAATTAGRESAISDADTIGGISQNLTGAQFSARYGGGTPV